MPANATVHVAVGIIINTRNEVLISRRRRDSHQGGLWEFPGGKVEAGEEVLSALDREFREELGLRVKAAFPLLRVPYDYGDKSVLLDVRMISDYAGIPSGREGQAVAWRPVQQLLAADFPAANKAIIRTLNLPAEIAITPRLDSPQELLELLRHLHQLGVSCVQLRQKRLDAESYLSWFHRAAEYCHSHHLQLIFNHDLATVPDNSQASGVHFSAGALYQNPALPATKPLLVSAACHNLQELQRAERLGCDLALLSPVRATDKYPDSQILGWTGFSDLAAQVSMPVYALGGVKRADLHTARGYGAFGIAGIGTFLDTAP